MLHPTTFYAKWSPQLFTVMDAPVAYTASDGRQINLYGKLYVPVETTAAEARFPVIVMGHGFSMTADIQIDLADYYARNGVAACVFDFAGGSNESRSAGRSSLEMSVLTESEDLAAMMDHVKTLGFIDPGRLYLLGESQGGWVVSYVAATRPGEVRGLNLLYPALSIGDWEIQFNRGQENIVYPYNPMKGTFFDSLGIPEMFLTHVGEAYYDAVYDGPFEQSRFVDGTISTLWIYDEIAKFPGSALIFHGGRDPLVPLASSRKAAEKWAARDAGTVRLVVDENAAHSRDSFTLENQARMRGDFLALILRN
jgi:pimeloyl-ACP methyl ester carboxylesterase